MRSARAAGDFSPGRVLPTGRPAQPDARLLCPGWGRDQPCGWGGSRLKHSPVQRLGAKTASDLKEEVGVQAHPGRDVDAKPPGGTPTRIPGTGSQGNTG